MSSQPPVLTLQFFPAEIRQNIFGHCLLTKDAFAADQYHKDTSYQTNPLLVALRGDKELYQEAVYLFYKINILYYNVANYKKFEGQGELERVKKVRHLGIDLDFAKVKGGFSYYFLSDGMNQSPVAARFLSFLLTRNLHSWSKVKVRMTSRNTNKPVEGIRESCQLTAPQIETLHINLCYDNSALYNVYLIVREIAVMSKRLRRVNVNMHSSQPSPQDLTGDAAESLHRNFWAYPSSRWSRYTPPTSPHHLIVQINHLFGKRASSSFQASFQDGVRELKSHVSWEATAGEVLKMNEHLNPDCEMFTVDPADPDKKCDCL